ncbi:hypothetical protein SKAU_G00131100 [Synaphobranchus kaupii]|uniref:Fibroblast growth factor n=1 Tax=Synaphobranchus kaupii TaxID=118154 RepID=A0A9Q1J2C5_SYNKA|nr:hypothetical protein SKAU_G00131100 [Synaphobranchus kaupii]
MAPLICGKIAAIGYPFTFNCGIFQAWVTALGITVRERHLYTANRRQGLFLEMGTEGAVRGTPEQTANSVLELRSVRAGETVIRGVSSSLYLCVDRNGHLRGQFLPLRNMLSSGKDKEERQNENQKPEQQHLDIDSEDPFGMGLQVSVRSPGFHSKE